MSGAFPIEQSSYYKIWLMESGEIAKNQWYLGEKNHGAVTWEYSQWNWIMCHRDRWIKELKASGQYPN